MTARTFVDTNILVYAHDSSAGRKAEKARAALEELWESGQGCLSLQVLQEFFVVVTRKVARPLSPAAAREAVVDYSSWRLHAPGRQDLLDAIDLGERVGISLWDALILTSATRLGCATLLSEDLSHERTYEAVTVRNPLL